MKNKLNSIDKKYMQMALNLALKAKGKTSPNPLVGAVIVKDGKVISRGFHKRFGSSHAEKEAITNAAGICLNKASLYVTLEPCVHFGKTEPCVDLIIESGISKIIIASKDPNPIVNGRGIRRLRSAGIKVINGVLENEARNINLPFFTYYQKKRPFIYAKVAQSLDGKIAAVTGDSKWITSAESRRIARRFRSQADAVLVGINTVLKDNPKLHGVGKRHPIRIILDTSLRIKPDCSVLDSVSDTYIFCSNKAYKGKKLKIRVLERMPGVYIEPLRLKDKKISISAVLDRLYKMNIQSLYVEGGSEVLGSFFDLRFVDKVLFFISPKIIGGKNAKSSVAGKGIDFINSAIDLKDVNIKRIGRDILIEAVPVFKKR